MRTLAWVLFLFPLAACNLQGSGGQPDPTARPPASPAAAPSRIELLAAPERLTMGGTAYVLDAYLWRDFMLSRGEADRSVRATVTVKPADSGAPAARLGVDRMWVINGEDIWSVELSAPSARGAGGLSRSASGGPEWDPGSEVTVVVRVRGADGQAHLLRLPRQTIQRTS